MTKDCKQSSSKAYLNLPTCKHAKPGRGMLYHITIAPKLLQEIHCNRRRCPWNLVVLTQSCATCHIWKEILSCWGRRCFRQRHRSCVACYVGSHRSKANAGGGGGWWADWGALELSVAGVDSWGLLWRMLGVWGRPSAAAASVVIFISPAAVEDHWLCERK